MAREILVEDVKGPLGWKKSYSVKGQLCRTLSGRRWKAMETRCHNTAYKVKYPTYRGTQNNFQSFDVFVYWSIEQVGYSQFDWHLDKDILGDNCSPTTCVFIPGDLNKFLNNRENDRGDYSLGVSLRNGGYRARCWDGFGTRIVSRVFQDKPSAFEAYIDMKESAARRLAEHWRGKVDERVYEALNNYKVTNECQKTFTKSLATNERLSKPQALPRTGGAP